MDILLALGIGLVGGLLSGLFGIGGGIVIVPALALAAKMPLQKAQGTSLAALLLPVGLLGVLEYSKKGDVDWKMGLLAALGLFLGAYGGAHLNVNLDPVVARKVFAGFLVVVAAYLYFKN